VPLLQATALVSLFALNSSRFALVHMEVPLMRTCSGAVNLLQLIPSFAARA